MEIAGSRSALAGLLLAGVLAAGCRSTMEDALASKESGSAAVYPLPVREAAQVARKILYEAAHFRVQTAPDWRRVWVDAGLGPEQTFVVVWIDPVPAGEGSEVTVHCRRRSATQMGMVLTDGQFHDLFEAEVERLAARREGGGR